MAPTLSAPASQPNYYYVVTERIYDGAPEPDNLLASGDNDKEASKLSAEIQLMPGVTMSASEIFSSPGRRQLDRRMQGPPRQGQWWAVMTAGARDAPAKTVTYDCAQPQGSGQIT